MADLIRRSRPVSRPLTADGLFETHLTVSDLSRSLSFYRDVVGLPVAFELPDRGAAFFWIAEPGQAMLGLWSLGSAPIIISSHVAFGTSLPNVLDACDRLRSLGFTAALLLRHRNRRAERDRLDASGCGVLP